MELAGVGLIMVGYIVRESDVLRHNSLQFALTSVGVVLVIVGLFQRRGSR